MATTYDAIGVMILPCRKQGKFKAARVGHKDGQIVVIQMLTENRSQPFALREARLDLEMLGTDLARDKVALTVPEQLTLKFE